MRVVLSIELIMRSVVVDMDVENVVPIARTSREIFSHACYA
jgi:hypothetical protein